MFLFASATVVSFRTHIRTHIGQKKAAFSAVILKNRIVVALFPFALRVIDVKAIIGTEKEVKSCKLTN